MCANAKKLINIKLQIIFATVKEFTAYSLQFIA